MKIRLLRDDTETAEIVDWPAVPANGTVVRIHSTGRDDDYEVERTQWHLGASGALLEVAVFLKKTPTVTAASLQMIA